MEWNSSFLDSSLAVQYQLHMVLMRLHLFDTLPTAKAGGFWDDNEPCLQKQQVLLALSTMDSALPIYLLRGEIDSFAFFFYVYGSIGITIVPSATLRTNPFPEL